MFVSTCSLSPMNITEVAKRAKVSTATVSRTINGSSIVSPETADKVWNVVRALGYHPNRYARALVSGRSHLLGLIISDIVNPFFPELIKSFEEMALQQGLEVLVANTNYDPERMSHWVHRMLERKVDGVGIMTSEMEEGLVAELEKRRIPIVFLDTGKVRSRISNIRVDYGKGIRAAMERLLALPKRPTAVLASNDLTAIGALRAIYNANLRIPEDISLVGFDDIYLSQFTQPALTTIRLSRTEVAEKAFNALTALINGKSQKGHEYHVETHLIIRSSTGLHGQSPNS